MHSVGFEPTSTSTLELESSPLDTQTQMQSSATGNRTPVSRVTGGDTSHYTIAEAEDSRQPLRHGTGANSG